MAQKPPSFPEDPFQMDPSMNFAGPSHVSGHAPPPHSAPLEYLSTPTTAGFAHFAPDAHFPPPQQPLYMASYPSGPSYVPQPQQAYLPPAPHIASIPNGYHLDHGPPMGYPPDDGGWMGQEWDDGPDDQGDVLYGNLEVKHRRRTTPEQLKVLEHWFDVNPKPDNNLREWLASELGMTKRNIQVWFQNRRAKVKGLAMKEKAAQTKASASGSDSENPPGNSTADPPSSDRKPANASATSQRPVIEPLTIIPPVSNTVPRPPLISQPASQPVVQQMLLPPVNTVNMGRRVSLANGEAAMIETWVAKRMAAGRHNANRAAGIPGFSPRSPSMGTAAAARRASIPYPPPINANGSFAFPQTAMSPLTRPMPSTLYLAAMRNNTRRSSVPGIPPVGTAQLISSAPFTPPRIGSGSYQVPPSTGRSTRDLSPIKDVDHDSGGAHTQSNFVFDEPASDLSATYLSTPVSTYAPNPNGGSTEAPFAPNAPLPNPAFSFGAPSDNTAQPAISDEEIHLWMTLQRGRLSSMASIHSTYAESAGTQDGSDHTVEWNSGLVESSPQPYGFEADARRASAPPDLLHNLGILGLHPSPLRPSPLGAPCGPDGLPSQQDAQHTIFPTYMTTTEISPSSFSFIDGQNGSIALSSGLTGSHSNTSSESVSPTGMQHLGIHGVAPGQLQYSPNSSASPYDMSGLVSGGLATPAHELPGGSAGFVFPPKDHDDANSSKDNFAFFDGVGAVNVLV